MKTISIINLKGGVAKTTTAVNLAYILAEKYGYRVLLIDNDKQGNLSKSFNCYDENSKYTTANLLTDKYAWQETHSIIKRTEYENIGIITANMDLLSANMQTMLDQTRQQQTRYKKALEEVSRAFDFCIIDNAPDINISIINALVITDYVITPLMIDQYSFVGLDVLKEQIEQIKEDFNPDIRSRILITQYQNNEVTNQGIEYMQRKGENLFNTHIRRTNKKVHESTFAAVPVVKYSPRCGASQDYKKFVAEFLDYAEVGIYPNL